MSNSNHKMSDADERHALLQDLQRVQCTVHQPDDPPLFTREPISSMAPVHWRWSDLLPLLNRLGERLKLEKGGNRRTLRLTNPGLPYGTTPSLWASIQVILPGEVATAHRHAATALRFIMTGNGAWTTVDGEEYPMNERDFVLTPAWTWHDHIHRGDEQMIWLDILDISLVRSMHATFFQSSPTPVQDVSPEPQRSWQQFGSGIMRPVRAQEHNPVNPLLVYPAAAAEQALHAAHQLAPDPHFDTALEYQNPTTGGAALPTISSRLQRIRPGFKTLPLRHTGSVILYVVAGQGRSNVGDMTFEWSPGDFIAIPPWNWYSHECTGNAAATFFTVSDVPALKALHLYQEEFAEHHANNGEQ